MGLATTAFGSIYGGIQQQNAQDKQFEYDRRTMEMQAGLNRQQATHSAKLQKDMWDYTNFENQVAHAEAAGLNPALLYAKGGASGQTGSAQAAGVAAGGSRAVEMGLQARALGAQIRMQTAQALKTEAEAEKIAGVDTDKTKTEIELNKATEELAKANADLAASNTKLNDQNIAESKKRMEKLNEEIGILAAEKEVANETKWAKIETAYEQYRNTVFAGIESQARVELTQRQAAYLDKQIEGFWYDLVTKRISADASANIAETMANRLTEEVKKWNKELSQEDTRILQQWIYGAAGAIADLGSTVAEFLPTKFLNSVVREGERNGKHYWEQVTQKNTTSKGR